MLSPDKEYIKITAEDNLKELKRKWKLPLSRDLIYKGCFSDQPVRCDIIGYNDLYEPPEGELPFSEDAEQDGHEPVTTTLIISIENELHCISPGYLSNMQKKDFNRLEMRNYEPEVTEK